ncbi:MAG: hypothetical protein ACK4WC_13205, partial [Rubrimonas sp.]
PDLATLYPPAEGWSLTYHLALEAGGPVQTLATSAEGFALDAAPAETALFAAGRWSWRAVLADGASRVTVGAGVLTVASDPALATAADTRTVNARILSAIEATLEGRATKDADAYSIEGRSISRTPMDVLLKARAKFAELVRRERGGAAVTVTRVRFT